MTTTDTDLPAALRMQLRGLREDIAPPAHLWDAIDARLDRAAAPPPPRAWRPAFALAAALAMAAVGGSWAWSSLDPAPAQRMARSDGDPALRDTFATLDRDARAIRRALRHDPTSRVLLQQLHRVDALRQTLARRVALG